MIASLNPIARAERDRRNLFGFGCALKFSCFALICSTCSASGFFAAAPFGACAFCWPAAATVAVALADASVAGVALAAALNGVPVFFAPFNKGVALLAAVAGVTDVCAFSAADFTPRLPCPILPFGPGVGLTAVSAVVFVSLWVLTPRGDIFFVSVAVLSSDFGLASVFSAFDKACSVLDPCSFTVVASGFGTFADFVSTACVFAVVSGLGALVSGLAIAPCVFSCFSFGVACSSGSCAIAAPASASEQPISKLVNFFIILVSLVVRRARSIQTPRSVRFLTPVRVITVPGQYLPRWRSCL